MSIEVVLFCLLSTAAGFALGCELTRRIANRKLSESLRRARARAEQINNDADALLERTRRLRRDG